ncbi:MAG: outer membrane beta-barrel domain-containing protein [Myxococcales bacterium]|nr:outer membrane beta-barrel domain-containing protein [Myxococcales bacterium]
MHAFIRHVFVSSVLVSLTLVCLSPVSASAKAPSVKETDTSNLSPRARRALRRRKLTQELARKGEAELRKSVRVFQQRYLVKARRAELTMGGSVAIGDALMDTYNLDAGLMVHINQSWAVGLSGSYSLASQGEAFNNIQSHFGLFPERSKLQASGFGELQFSPIFGKFNSFGMAVVQMDAYLIAAAGAVRTTIGDGAMKPSWQIGAGLRVHTWRALTVSLEVRDIMFVEKFQAGDRLMQHWFGGIKIGLWIPPTFQYKYQR